MRLNVLFLMSVVFIAGGAVGGERPGGTAFVAAGDGAYRFDTGALRGVLRPAGRGKSLGLSELVHQPTGVRLDGPYGIFSHYRVFTTGKRYGVGAWDWPSEAALLADGAVRVHWSAEEERPFALTATYRISGPETIDLETSVTARRELPGFESFLASYFREEFPAAEVYVKAAAAGGGRPGLRTAERTFGDKQMFARDREVVPLIQDGRWKLEPHPVDWTLREGLVAPLALRRDPKSGSAAILMAPREDCFAVSAFYPGEAHRSVYLSLFGGTIKAGESRRARTRLVVASSPTEQQVVAMYEAYLKFLKGNP